MEITDSNNYRYYRSVVTEFFRTAESVIRQESYEKPDTKTAETFGVSAVTVKSVKSGRQIENVRVALKVLDRYAKIKTETRGVNHETD